MSNGTTSNLQLKLSLDQGLTDVWGYLKKEYQGLDKSSIVRLALNTLFKETKRSQYRLYSIEEILKELEGVNEGMTEKEIYNWWNKNKPL
ncbi:MAG: hypothetical protein AAB441_04625 [Patescibacteria group bacterium]